MTGTRKFPICVVICVIFFKQINYKIIQLPIVPGFLTNVNYVTMSIRVTMVKCKSMLRLSNFDIERYNLITLVMLIKEGGFSFSSQAIFNIIFLRCLSPPRKLYKHPPKSYIIFLIHDTSAKRIYFPKTLTRLAQDSQFYQILLAKPKLVFRWEITKEV